MGNIVFSILLAALIITLFLSAYYHSRQKRKTRYESYLASFGQKDGKTADTGRFDNVPRLYGYTKENVTDAFYLDDITVNDLGIRDVYSRINRCVSCAGSDVLYCMLRSLNDPQEASQMYDLIDHYMSNAGESVEVMKILDSIPDLGSFDGASVILDLSEEDQKSMLYDILPVLLLAVSIGLCALIPLAGLICVIIMICICIFTYFNGKDRMDANLRGLGLCLRLIACSHDLCMAGTDGFDEFADLYTLKRGDFLIPYKTKTASDPLSVIYDYVRMITHIDLIAYRLKIGSIIRLKDKLLKLYIRIGRLDTAISMASYLKMRAHCRADRCADIKVEAKALYHPLVDDPVCNDLVMKRGIVLTGSNASGKSTFLKALGLNVIFAGSFGFAFADRFETGVKKLLSSMALSDDLLNKESYYVVEARSIKRICDEEGAALCIIDEVLRGTNTIERIAASSQILRSLCRPGILCIAATHDLELTKLLDDVMDDYYFTEEICEDTVKFTYTLKKGSTDKTNAIRLLSMLGYDEVIVDSANELVKRYKKTGSWVEKA